MEGNNAHMPWKPSSDHLNDMLDKTHCCKDISAKLMSEGSTMEVPAFDNRTDNQCNRIKVL